MEVTNWKSGWELWDLIFYLKEVGALRTGNLFRGQSNADWGLVPALYRQKPAATSQKLSVAELYLHLEEQMLRAFFDEAALLLPSFRRAPLTDRFVAQHYGVPTQLLDWTLDPFIALFFAVNDGDPEKDCALFYIEPLTQVWGDRVDIPLPWLGKIAKLRPPVLDDRIRTQKSFFTLQNFGDADTFKPLEERELKVSLPMDGTHEDDEVSTFGKIVIPADRKQQIHLQLLSLGVDTSLVYPGLQGIGARIASSAKFGLGRLIR